MRSPISTSPSLNSHPFSLTLFSVSQQSFFAPFLPTHPKIPFHPLFFLLSTFICGHVIPRPASRLFFFYLTRTFTLPFSQHLPHPSLSHPPFPLFFLHPTHHTCSTFHSHIHSLKSKITGWDQIFIHRIRIPGLYILIHFSSVHFVFHFTFTFNFIYYFYFNFILLLFLFLFSFSFTI